MPVTGSLESAVEDAAVTRCRRQLAQQLKVDSVRASATAGLDHPASSMSAADLMAVLLDGHLRLDFCDPRDSRRDHLIFSKGRAWPLYYAMLKAAGAIRDEELLGFPKFGRWPLGDSLQLTLPTDLATGLMGRDYPSASAWPWPAGAWTGCPAGSGCCAGTPRWPRAPPGRRSATAARRPWTT